MTSTRRFASIIRLQPEREAEYRELHANVWPEVLRAIADAGIRNYSIFLRDGLLFSYLEYVGGDYEADMATLALDEATRRWWQLTDPCQAPLENAADGEWWAPAIEVFHTDGAPGGGAAP
jgi:L-rhamnose mutarotase